MRTPEESELHPQHRREEVVDPHDPSVRVAVTAISLADSPDGTANDDVVVYRTSGPGADPAVGLPDHRGAWITGRGDVEPYEGRSRHLADDGRAAQRRGGRGFTGGALRFLVQRGERLGLQEIAQVTARGGPIGQEIAGGFGEPWGSGSGHEWDKQLSQTRGGLTCP